MEFRIWLENTLKLPIAAIVMTKDELQQAVENITRGYPAMTTGPVEVAILKSRRYQLVNGYHRMVQFLLNGQEDVVANIVKGEWRLPSKNERFVFKPDLPFKGLEDFIEPYLLKRL